MTQEEIKKLEEILSDLHKIETSFSVEFDSDLPHDLEEAYRHVSIAAEYLENFGKIKYDKT